ncbi:NK-tumor recognition protein-like [Patiria miniata]|uniref:Uncharacterized protein n=1 Tax=Patiria miniata TaxID=46514 RepID=A0A913ZQZ4_PATMI|nr:NK-tumor recognition protein-like [Patiria miniata]
MSVQSPRTGPCKSDTDPGVAPGPGPGSDDSTLTQTPTTGGDTTSGAAADCSMATDSGGGEDSPSDYNKRKYHASKMDLNLKILRDQMANLTSSGSSLSRQLASVQRNIQEIKDDDDDGEEADSEYESEDEQKIGSTRDALDTEDDVNKMSDLEKDYSEPKIKRSVSTSSRSKKSKTAARDPNPNEVGHDGSQARHGRSNSRQESVESYQDSDSECSQCLCCNSMASYSSTPWRYISRGEGSTMDEDSDSSEYFTDDSEYSTTTSNMPAVDIHKRLSPFYCPSDHGESGSHGANEEGRFDDADQEQVVDHRMSPLGCESPRKCSSQPELSSMAGKSDKMAVETDKPQSEEKAGETVETQEGEEKAPKASSLIGIFKAQESKAKQEEMASVAKAKRVEELRRKNSDIRLKNEQKRRAEMEEKLKNKPNVDTDSPKSSPLVSEIEDGEKVNIKDRISCFEGQKKTKDEEDTDKDGLKNSKKSPNVEKGTNTEQDSMQQMPDVIPGVTDEKLSQEEPTKTQGDHDQHKSHKSKHKIAKTTIEIPVSCLPEEIIHPEPGMPSDHPTMMTFQVQPGDVEAMSGPILVSRSPKPKRRMSKTIVRLSSTDASPSSMSESTLVADTDKVRMGAKKPSGHSHSVCPHCQKKNKPGESKRVVKVLQLQPVPESPQLSPVSTMVGDSAHVFQQPGGRIIKMIPSKTPNVVQRQESSKDGVVFRFNMGMPENAPLQVGDYIRIPIQPQQQYPPTQVRHVQQGSSGGLVIRTEGQPRRQREVITFRQSSSRPSAGNIRVQQRQSPTSGVTVHTSQPGVRVMPSEGGGVKLVFGS